ncbi:uncharacterized protein LOC116656581 isoform X1 [Drosophila ananassae]|uniref:uncharacterized protein LOC116656581 isoform X1 n=1 Tax=Drosophila ananassae TaxID=7217 RepID=UPI0013A5E7EF|nr:uncharacterized protein LOC116656581 isoform X1 [Drosophila ananassae]
MVIAKSSVLKILFILQFVNNSVQTIYDLTLEEERIFSDCPEKLQEYDVIDNMFDFSKMSFTMTEEGVILEGFMLSFLF